MFLVARVLPDANWTADEEFVSTGWESGMWYPERKLFDVLLRVPRRL
jgi:hypothetical protein